mmetsp:Transcript_6726/g.16210  ORF Transcript_6726/g.16210 Transcript_6726/m.16210 type:complete len:285 (+) Transcript_6726:585-1439(+)
MILVELLVGKIFVEKRENLRPCLQAAAERLRDCFQSHVVVCRANPARHEHVLVRVRKPPYRGGDLVDVVSDHDELDHVQPQVAQLVDQKLSVFVLHRAGGDFVADDDNRGGLSAVLLLATFLEARFPLAGFVHQQPCAVVFALGLRVVAHAWHVLRERQERHDVARRLLLLLLLRDSPLIRVDQESGVADRVMDRAQRRVALVVELAVGQVAAAEEVPHIAVRPVEDGVEAQEGGVVPRGGSERRKVRAARVGPPRAHDDAPERDLALDAFKTRDEVLFVLDMQ